MMRRRFTINKNVQFDPLNYATIEALEDGLVVSLKYNLDLNLEYCVDDSQDWVRLLSEENTVSINKGQTILFRADGANFSFYNVMPIGNFTISKKCRLTGNCMSLIWGDNAKGKGFLKNGLETPYFYGLFRDCDTIVEISTTFLPATTLKESCYSHMFYGCTSLTTAPELPATTLARECYSHMFSNCWSLIQAPELPATDLAISCYEAMFSFCTNLKQAPNLPATTLVDGCYGWMFSDCRSLTTAPELPATTLAKDCYDCMFYNCFNLNYIKMLATDISATNCLNHWFGNITSTGTFVKNKDATWDVRGVSGIPSNWKIEYDHNYDIGSDISFHIERIDETLYAKDWMTWDDWVHSKYNTVSARISSHEILIPSYSSYPLDTYPNNIIKNGGTYYFKNTGGGSSD